ncbi:MAG: DUF2207 domain-containing protein [Terriglobales bacterium]
MSAAFADRVGRRLILALLFCFALAIPAFARDWHIARFESHIYVASDGVTTVNEHIDLVFIGEYHGIYRDIPVEYPGPHGSNYTLFLKVISVLDGSGHKLKYDSSTQHGSRHLKIYIPDAVDTTRSVIISYKVTNAVRWFDGHDELYWNVTGNDWPVPIDSAAASITFPANAAGNLRAQAFTGAYGSQEQDATAEVRNSTVVIETNNPLSMRDGLTADVYISKGVLTQPSKGTQAMWFLRSNPIVLLPLWAFIVMFVFWWTKGRDPKPDISVAPMYEPPKDMTPAEVGSLIDDAVHPRDITCTMVDLAVKGYLKIEETESKVLLFSHRDYKFHLLKPRETWSALQPHERVMLNHMFSGGATASLASALQDVVAGIRLQQGHITLSPQSAASLESLGSVAPGAASEQVRLSDLKDHLDDLLPHQAKDAVSEVCLSDLKNQFYVAIPTMKNDILAELKSKGMYSVDPESAHAYVLAGILFTAVPFVLAQVLGWGSMLDSPGLLIAAGILAAIIVFLFARIMTAKSLKGVRTKVEILGFQEFINRVDADRLKRMPPDTFEKFLPYAMALGLENRWAKAFQGITQNQPTWYVGPTPYVGFNAIFFATSMHAMAMDAHQAFVAAPRASSGGSGWGGGAGGFSGGGFGGGGGGAF